MIAEVLAPGGLLARELAQYEDRPEQRQVAEAIASALDDGHNLLVEAGTGTGKSIAYLVPALSSGKRVVVSTGTRALQDQLLGKDLPALRRVLPHAFDAVVLKGTRNYLCRRKLAEAGASAPELVRGWAQRTLTGDIAELAELAESDEIWERVTVSPEARLGPRCPHYETCFVTRARRLAERADLVVVNHHLFFADLILRRRGGGAHVLPDYDVVIFDEAHQLEDVLSAHFGVELSSARVEYLLRDARHILARDAERATRLVSAPGLLQRLLDEVGVRRESFFQVLAQRLRPLAHGPGERFALPEGWLDEGLQSLWLALDAALDDLAQHVRLAGSSLVDDGAREVGEELRGLAERAHRIRDDLAAIFEGDPGRGQYVYWASLRGPVVSLHASPVSVEHVLREELLPQVASLVLTSATLSAGGSFAYVRERLGLGPDLAEELVVESPFDYPRQCLLYLPRDLPESGQGLEVRAERVAELLAITEGRAFVLFTSHRALGELSERVRSLVPWPILCQGQAPKRALLETFEGTPGSVLFATASFWEGVDVPGAALSQVLIDKLPFDVPDDPLTAARMQRAAERGLDPFVDYQLPRAALALRQGFGRLIRRKSDRGIVSVLDPRIVHRSYGRYFVRSLPEVARTGALHQVRKWWQHGS